MRFRLSYVAFAGLLVPLSTMGLIAGCGSTTDTGDGGDGGGNDATTDTFVKPDSPPDVVEEPEASCPPPLNLDSGLLATVDAGSFTPCLDCLFTQCGTQINGCNADCQCRQDVLDTVTCVTSGGGTTCVADLAGDNAGLALLGCGEGSCKNACLGGGGDGGTDGATDASGD